MRRNNGTISVQFVPGWITPAFELQHVVRCLSLARDSKNNKLFLCVKGCEKEKKNIRMGITNQLFTQSNLINPFK